MEHLTYEYGRQMALKLRPDLDELMKGYEFEIDGNTPAEQLHACLEQYNWDDGFSVPYLIVCHPNCALATAVDAFWLSEGDSYFEDGFMEEEVSPYQKDWKEFVIFITERILQNHYNAAGLGFPSQWKLSRAQLLYRQKHGWEKHDGIPDIFHGLGDAWESVSDKP